MKLGSAYVQIKAKFDELTKGLGTAKTQTSTATGDMNRSLTGTSGKITGMGTAATTTAGTMKTKMGNIGGSFTTLGGIATTIFMGTVATAFGSAIKAASDLQEVQGKFDTVFEGQEEIAEGWALGLQSSYGMSGKAAKEYLGNIQDLLVPLGMNSKAAGAMANKIVQLATDLGSFNNMDTADVMRDIGGALTGSGEVMKKYGIVLTAANLQQEAMNLGLADSPDLLTAADKATAAYSIIVRDSKAAHGDFMRTSDGLANSLKILGGKWTDLVGIIGTEFLPIATWTVQALSDFISYTDGSRIAFYNFGAQLYDWLEADKLATKQSVNHDKATRALSGTTDIGTKSMLAMAKQAAKNEDASFDLIGVVDDLGLATEDLTGDNEELRKKTEVVTRKTTDYGAAVEGAKGKSEDATTATNDLDDSMGYLFDDINAVVGEADDLTLGFENMGKQAEPLDDSLALVDDELSNIGDIAGVLTGDEAGLAGITAGFADLGGGFTDAIEGEGGMSAKFDDFWGGVVDGWGEINTATTDWGALGKETVKTFASDSKDALTDSVETGLEAVLKGSFSDIGNAWDVMLDGMGSALITALAGMVATYIESGVTEMLTGEDSETVIGSVLGGVSDTVLSAISSIPGVSEAATWAAEALGISTGSAAAATGSTVAADIVAGATVAETAATGGSAAAATGGSAASSGGLFTGATAVGTGLVGAGILYAAIDTNLFGLLDGEYVMTENYGRAIIAQYTAHLKAMEEAPTEDNRYLQTGHFSHWTEDFLTQAEDVGGITLEEMAADPDYMQYYAGTGGESGGRKTGGISHGPESGYFGIVAWHRGRSASAGRQKHPGFRRGSTDGH